MGEHKHSFLPPPPTRRQQTRDGEPDSPLFCSFVWTQTRWSINSHYHLSQGGGSSVMTDESRQRRLVFSAQNIYPGFGQREWVGKPPKVRLGNLLETRAWARPASQAMGGNSFRPRGLMGGFGLISPWPLGVSPIGFAAAPCYPIVVSPISPPFRPPIFRRARQSRERRGCSICFPCVMVICSRNRNLPVCIWSSMLTSASFFASFPPLPLRPCARANFGLIDRFFLPGRLNARTNTGDPSSFNLSRHDDDKQRREFGSFAFWFQQLVPASVCVCSTHTGCLYHLAVPISCLAATQLRRLNYSYASLDCGAEEGRKTIFVQGYITTTSSTDTNK